MFLSLSACSPSVTHTRAHTNRERGGERERRRVTFFCLFVFFALLLSAVLPLARGIRSHKEKREKFDRARQSWIQFGKREGGEKERHTDRDRRTERAIRSHEEKREKFDRARQSWRQLGKRAEGEKERQTDRDRRTEIVR